MKHTHRITYILIALFFFSQIIGIYIINKNIDVTSVLDNTTGQVTNSLNYEETPGLETMKVEDESTSYIPIFISIIVGTILGLLLAKFNKTGIWKFWFLFAVIIALYKSFSVFIPAAMAIATAVVFAYFKIFKPNFYVHNFTELFIYAGIASIFVPILNVVSATILLILIALYDAFAVWKSKHMITLAKFQSKAVFAGLSLQYDSKSDKLVKSNPANAHFNMPANTQNIPKPNEEIKIKQSSHPHSQRSQENHLHHLHPQSNIKTAILGGGDIAFPLLFSGAVLKGLLLTESATTAFFKTAIIAVFATMALGTLLVKAEKDKFYPAMPFITAGCFVGYAIIFFI